MGLYLGPTVPKTMRRKSRVSGTLETQSCFKAFEVLGGAQIQPMARDQAFEDDQWPYAQSTQEISLAA